MSEVLKCRIEGHLWVDALLFAFFSQIERVNEVRGSFTLSIGRGDERWELIVTNVLISGQLDEIQQRLFLAHVWEERYKLWVSIFALSQSGNDTLLCLDHLRDQRSERSLIYLITKWQDHIDSRNVVMSRHTRLICEAKHLELLFYVTVNPHSYVFRPDRTIPRGLLFFLLWVFLFLWRSDFTLQNCLILLRDRHQLLAVKVCLALLFRLNFLLVCIVDLCVGSLESYTCRVGRIILLSHFAKLFKRGECFLASARVNLHSKL